MHLYYKPEYWDLYDRAGKHFGKIRRGVAIPGGLYHVSVEIIPTDMQGHLLITRRSFNKRKGGGLYEFPAGSVLAGENPIMAAIRELREETGLKAYKLIHLQTEKTPYNPNASGLIRQTYVACIENLFDQKVHLQREETIDYRVVTLEELKRDYLNNNKFDMSRLSMYRSDFFERLAKIIGTPEEEKTVEEKETIPKSQFRLVKTSLSDHTALEHAGAPGEEEL